MVLFYFSYRLAQKCEDEFGVTDFDKMVSALDIWIGKFLERIDIDNTLIILTSDHGEFIPTSKVGHELTYIAELFEPGKIMKEKTTDFIYQWFLFCTFNYIFFV